MNSTRPIRGLLYSQVGYESTLPVRIVIRSTDRNFLSAQAKCQLTKSDGNVTREALCEFWGSLWGSYWWIAEFIADLPEGQWSVKVSDQDTISLADDGLTVAKNILWDRTVHLMAIEMLESRALLAKAKSGWMDAGMMWQESNAQSTMILGLLDVIEYSSDRLDSMDLERIEKQVINGCNYLVATQKKATELGHPDGAMCHDIIGNENEILPSDALKAVVALRRSSRLLSDQYAVPRRRYADCAHRTYRWLLNNAQPLGDQGFSRRQRGIPYSTPIPQDEWPTRDLVMRCWGALETWKCGDADAKHVAVETAREIIARQFSRENSEAGYFGHFREFRSLDFSEKSWSHSIYQMDFGADAGGIFPNYLIPFLEMLRLWPEHVEAHTWQEALNDFVYGYLLPGCQQNPFLIIPLGIFGHEGPLYFAGTFHGMNAIYGFTAALAVELYELLNDPKLLEVAYSNLQWIAGLNAGLTTQSLETGSVVFKTDTSEGTAIPVSMIHGVGHRTAGTWFGTRGVICNGFGTGKQFEHDVDPLAVNDGPHSFTDEDWIPGSAGWLAGICRLQNYI
ncbi:MAG: hypothetical protein AAGD11_19550 [Planctomycetota bacterium]